MRSSTRSSSSNRVVLAASRSGRRYASYGGLHLNSAYDPLREAGRFLDTHPQSATMFIIIGDTLPYLRALLHERFPEAEVVSIYLHRDFPVASDEHDGRPPQEDFWSPASSESLYDYLLRRLTPAALNGIAVLQWPPAFRAFPDLADMAVRAVEQVVRESTGELVTSAAFARAWIHNLFSNFLSVDRWHLLEPHHKPVVVAASGPSLAQAIPAIRANRRRLALVALPSSLEALAAADLRPDLLVTVDAGYWAQLHLRALDKVGTTPVAFPLVASRGLWRWRSLPVIFSAGSFVERELFRQSGLAPFEILATATVSASAVELASRWTDGPILVAGLDLSYDRLEEHVRPHAFDIHLEANASRMRPHLAVVAERLLNLGLDRSNGSPAVTPALKTYTDWFRDWSGAGRVYRLFPSRVPLAGFRVLSNLTAFLEGFPEDPAVATPVPAAVPHLPQRRESVTRLLDSWTTVLEAARSDENAPHGIESGENRVDTLVSSLAPRDYLRFRRAHRLGSEGTSDGWTRLLDETISELADMKRRFVP